MAAIGDWIMDFLDFLDQVPIMLIEALGLVVYPARFFIWVGMDSLAVMLILSVRIIIYPVRVALWHARHPNYRIK
jgi:hypothetical protein